MSVSSVSIAKERLRNLLVSDRIQCTPDAVERLTTDLYHTVSKYMEIEQEERERKRKRKERHRREMGENN